MTVESNWDEMMVLDGADLVIEAERSPGVRDPALTLSAEALDRLRNGLTLWVATRMMRAMDQGTQPQKVAIHIHVALDGKAAQ